jgi:release factor glutamine methyltransferase
LPHFARIAISLLSKSSHPSPTMVDQMLVDRMSISTCCDSMMMSPVALPSWDYTNRYYNDEEEYNSEAFNFGRPRVEVLKKFPEWSVLLVSRGTGPNTLLEWISGHRSECFDIPDLVYSSDSEVESPSSFQEQEVKRNDFDPVLANPPSSTYAKTMVLVAKNPSVLAVLVNLKVTVHCLVKGRHTPQSVLDCETPLDGIKNCATRGCSLEVVPSITAGHISLVVASNTSAEMAPRQFRRHFKNAGWPILGTARDALSFRGEQLCMSMVRLEFLAIGVSVSSQQGIMICAPPAPELRQILEREERLFQDRNRGGLASLQRELFEHEIPRPVEYERRRATFDGLEFRVTPAVMIPKKGSQALVDRVVSFFTEGDSSKIVYPLGTYRPRPVVLDLGTGCGNLLVSILHRLRTTINAYAVGMDSSREALEIADYNIAALGMRDFARTIKGKFHQVRNIKFEKFSAVVCNPPYHTGTHQMDASTIAHEPRQALFVDGNQDHLIHYKDVLSGLTEGNICYPGAFLVFEALWENVRAVASLMRAYGIENVSIGMDANECMRTVQGTIPCLAD